MDDLSNMYGLNDLVGAVMGWLTRIWNIYTVDAFLLTAFLGIWLLRRVVRLFNRL